MSLNKAISRGVISGIFLSMIFGVNTYAAIEGSVNDNVVNVRANSTTSSDIITTVDAGQKVLINYSRDGFYNVSFGTNNDVFISQDFVNVKETSVVVNDNGVNVRNSASKDGAILGQVNMGDTFTVKTIDGEWCSIDFNGSNAYIHTDFLNSVAAAPTTVALPTAPVATVVEPTPVEVAPVVPVVQAAPVETEASIETKAFIEPDLMMEPETTLEAEATTEAENIAEIETTIETETTFDTEYIAETETTSEAEYIAETETVVEPVTVETEPVFTAPTEETYAVIEADTGLNMRISPTTDSEIIAVIPSGASVNVQSINQYWLEVKYNDLVGYVSTEFISIHSGPIPVAVAPDATKAEEIIAYAEQFLGTPYVYGGTDLNNGVDCSGFVYSVFKDNGIQLNRSSRDMYHNGVYVEKSDLQPGDLIFFAADGVTISHVGIYIGDGKYIHSTDGKGNGVSYANLYDDYSERTYYGARRVL